MKNIIVCKKYDWLWMVLLIPLFIAGIGFMLQLSQPIPDFEKAGAFAIGLFMFVGSGYGILTVLFGDQKTEVICTWIYGSLMALAGLAFFISLIVCGISELIKVIL